MNLLQTLEAEQMKALRATPLPDFRAGDTLKVSVKVVDVTFDEKNKQNKIAPGPSDRALTRACVSGAPRGDR